MASLAELIFGKRIKKSLRRDYESFFKTLTAYAPVFTSWEGGVYESMQCRAAINAIASHASKLVPKVVGSARLDLETILKYRPNPWQTPSQFLYRLATIWAVHNTAFIFPLEDGGTLVGYYSGLPERCELTSDGREPWIRYFFSSGETAAIEMSHVGILTNFQYRDDFFGTDNRALLPTMELIHAQNQGIQEGIKNSATYRFFAKVGNFTKPEDLAKERKRFTAQNFGEEDDGGVLLFPNTYENIAQITSQPFVVNAAQMSAIDANVNNYFGVNTDILQNKAYGDDLSAFYEGKIAPWGVQVGQVMTNMTFSPQEIGDDKNRIEYGINNLQFLDAATKSTLGSAMLDRGVWNRNEVRDKLWNQDPIPGGDEYIMRGEYKSSDEGGNSDDNE